MAEMLKLASIRLDGDTQLRSETHQDVVQTYAQNMLDGDVFPPIVVYYDGISYWLSDGFHRFLAVQQIEKDEILTEVREGTRRDALLYAAEANRKHGLQLSHKDKRRVVTLFLNDVEWSKWSDREIARRCGVSHPFVSSLRSSLENVTSDERTYTTKYGTVATMNVSRIGNDPYDGLSEYVVNELQERDTSSDDIAAIARWAREYKADIKKSATRALLTGMWMHTSKTEGRRIGEPPYTQEELEREGWVLWCLAPRDLDAFIEVGELQKTLHGIEEAKGKDFFDITNDDILSHISHEETLALANMHTNIMFRSCYTIWHYITFGMSQEQLKEFQADAETMVITN